MITTDYQAPNFNGAPLDVRLHRYEPGAPLVICFHGAVRNRHSSTDLYFGSKLRLCVRTSVASIVDPALSAGRQAVTSWYAAHVDGESGQAVVQEAVEGLVSATASSRPIFVGGSAGGFASMYFATLFENSVAVAVNPQVDLVSYWARQSGGDLPEGVRDAWPNCSAASEVANLVSVKAYENSGNNGTIVYVQNSRDVTHVAGQLAEFLHDWRDLSRLVLDVQFFGTLGHSGSVPLAVYEAWVEAAALAQTVDADAIAVSRHQLQCRHGGTRISLA